MKAESGGNVLHVKLFSCSCSHVLASAYLLLKHVTSVHFMCSTSVPRVSIRARRLCCCVETGEACYLWEYQMRADSASISWFLKRNSPSSRACLRYSHCWYSTSESTFKHRHWETGKGRNISSSMPPLRVCHRSGTQSGRHISLGVCLMAEQTCR